MQKNLFDMKVWHKRVKVLSRATPPTHILPHAEPQFTSKQLSKEALKCEKNAKMQKEKVAAAIKKGDQVRAECCSPP